MVGPIAGAKVADNANSATPIGCFAFGISVMINTKDGGGGGAGPREPGHRRERGLRLIGRARCLTAAAADVGGSAVVDGGQERSHVGLLLLAEAECIRR